MADKVKNMLDAIMLENQKSPLEMLTSALPPENEDLLAEAMSGRLGAPTPHPTMSSKDFGDVVGDLKSSLAKSTAVAEEEPPAPEPEEAPAEEPAPEVPAQEEPPKQEEEPSGYFHALNQEQVALRTQYDQLLARVQQQQDAERQMKARQEQEAQIDKDAENYYQYGFESPDQMKAYRQYQQQLVQAEMSRHMMPMMNQLADDRFNLALAKVKQDSPHFAKYFPDEVLISRYENIKRQIGPQVAGTTNWETELRNAYRIADMPRIEAQSTRQESEIEKLKKEIEDLRGRGKETRARQKADLKLVPKAGNQGATGGKRNFADELDELPPSVSFGGAFAERIKKNMSSILGA